MRHFLVLIQQSHDIWRWKEKIRHTSINAFAYYKKNYLPKFGGYLSIDGKNTSSKCVGL